MMDSPSSNAELILASSSKYRQSQLRTLGHEFRVQKEPVDETPLLNEAADALALRLSRAKAYAVARQNPNSIVIGADQVAAIEGRIMGKPGTQEKACEQLTFASGKMMRLHSAFAIFKNTHMFANYDEPISIQFRDLTAVEIRTYVELDLPLDCAGSFKSESRGPLLFQSIQCHDPTAIIGLPLIALARNLRTLGLNPLTQ